MSDIIAIQTCLDYIQVLLLLFLKNGGILLRSYAKCKFIASNLNVQRQDVTLSTNDSNVLCTDPGHHQHIKMDSSDESATRMS